MKKRFVSLALALLLCLSLLPAATLAAEPLDLEAEFFGEGLSAPAAPYLHAEMEDGPFYSLYFEDIPEFLQLVEAVNLSEDFDYIYNMGQVDFFENGIQIDYRFDGGPWASTKTDWDSFDYGEDYIPYVFRAQEAFYTSNGDKLKKVYSLINLEYYDEEAGEPAFLTPYVKMTPDEWGYSMMKTLDLKNHTLGMRIRGYVYYTLYEGAEPTVLFSDWSPESSIGKNGNQKPFPAPTKPEAPVISRAYAGGDYDGVILPGYYLELPKSVYSAYFYHDIKEDMGSYYISTQVRRNGGAWEEAFTIESDWLRSGYTTVLPATDLRPGDRVELRARIESDFPEGDSPWSNVIAATAHKTTAWAAHGMAQADELALIPERLTAADLTARITRGEFAAVCVKLYEALSGETAPPVADNPFIDTEDVEILKAYGIGAVDGIDVGIFAPNAELNRQQAATMLTRVFKAAFWEGWTLAGDGDYTAHSIATTAPHGIPVYLNLRETAADPKGGIAYTAQTPFADDADIADWAKDSVYFMAVNGIIDGIGDNLFAPKGDLGNETGYGLATREQAIKLAVAMADSLK